ncbi:hypothetical protein GCM10009850_059080 [Nonomuraea monospora]|uniref:Uncharacterized protein n=1 Tax=Nonomuraea monospora TaxID=568818 RepID=A0ABN3CLW2_9ACTN
MNLAAARASLRTLTRSPGSVCSEAVSTLTAIIRCRDWSKARQMTDMPPRASGSSNRYLRASTSPGSSRLTDDQFRGEYGVDPRGPRQKQPGGDRG